MPIKFKNDIDELKVTVVADFSIQGDEKILQTFHKWWEGLLEVEMKKAFPSSSIKFEKQIDRITCSYLVYFLGEDTLIQTIQKIYIYKTKTIKRRHRAILDSRDEEIDSILNRKSSKYFVVSF